MERYAGRCATFNDDMQGTAAVVLAAVLPVVRAAGTRLRDQVVVVHGAGAAGVGVIEMLRDAMVADGLPAAEAAGRFYALGSRGLLVSGQPGGMRDFQVPYARSPEEVVGWARSTDPASPTLADVVAAVRPTLLIGTSASPGAFTEAIVKEMAAGVERPIILPLSNPTSKSEAQPEDLVRWTEGRALIATGSPFPPVAYEGRNYAVAQANNALVFPGLGLGVAVSRARRVSNGMLAAAAHAVAELAGGHELGDPLLPPVSDLRRVSAAVALAVIRAAVGEDLAADLTDPATQVRAAMWEPAYGPLEVL